MNRHCVARIALPLLICAAVQGCAVVAVAGAATGAVVSVAGAVVSAGVRLTGKVVEKTIDAITPSRSSP